MLRIDVRELRQNASRYLARVKAGETVEVTERGVLVARLVPPLPSESARDRLVAAGRLVPARNPRRLAGPLHIDGPLTGEVLDALREDRL
ncbi:type II toxin-antitoxin system Phd/YefM family antitoxin [Blastococcus capsensis]|uniref:type II toxin-antitoxin system Phd/YefM family antitoxin n=1 Tax=Blastococcus capsensis TaxID=1564163 RepID=UPI0025416638|nr:type II toxin-antitoxin system prevent-host-death family antitoxin [Blastococcus capsensis]MDK3255011.1 type II toxin-antitoxin system prevent-host-death family antitoxin [Blastococcus capsensis]